MASNDTTNNSKSSAKGDDFLAQVLKTEEQAEQIVQKSQEKKHKNLEKLKSSLEEDRSEALEKAKKGAKVDLGKASISAKINYESLVKDAQGKSDDLLASKGGMLAGLMKEAQDFFLQKL